MKHIPNLENWSEADREFFSEGNNLPKFQNPPPPPAPAKYFIYFANHGKADGNGCYTICFTGKNEDGEDDFGGDEIVVAVLNTEWEAKESCKRLNAIIQGEPLTSEQYSENVNIR